MKTFPLQVCREYPLSPQGWKCPHEYWNVYMCLQFLENWGLFEWSSLKFTDELCLCPWLCFFLLRKHTEFCQTFRLRRDADWGGFGWREILSDRFLNHNLMEKIRFLPLGNPKGIISQNFHTATPLKNQWNPICFFKPWIPGELGVAGRWLKLGKFKGSSKGHVISYEISEFVDRISDGLEKIWTWRGWKCLEGTM